MQANSVKLETILLIDDDPVAAAITDYKFCGLIICVFIRNSSLNYNGGYSDFQMIVPEDNSDNKVGTNYYFFLELG